ncbi:MAG: hypothetical protein V4736_00940 [Bdellovibrionota bacterium]
MGYVLYENGKKIGEIEDWVLIDRPAVTKMVLGKEITTPKPKDQCTFVSPKPVDRRGTFSVIEDQKIEYVIKATYVKHSTNVTADVLEKRKI